MESRRVGRYGWGIPNLLLSLAAGVEPSRFGIRVAGERRSCFRRSFLASVSAVGLVVWLLCGTLTAPSALAATGVRAFYGEEGTKGGQFGVGGQHHGIAVNQAGTGGAGAGDVYVADGANNRIQQFTESGEFIRAFGLDVGGPNIDVCTEAASCQAGETSGQAGGMASPEGIAIERATGNVYVTDYGNRRVDIFTATGLFEGAFGWNVNANAPAETLQFCTVTTGCKVASEGAGAGQFAQFKNERVIGGIAVSPTDGDLVVASAENRRVDEFIPVLIGATVTGIEFIHGFGWGAATGADEFQVCTISCHSPGSSVGAALGQFGEDRPSHVTVDAAGTILAPDSGSFFQAPRARVMKFDATGQPLGLFAQQAFSAEEALYDITADVANGEVIVAKLRDLIGFGPDGEEVERYLRGPETKVEIGPDGEEVRTEVPGSELSLVNSFIAVAEASGVVYATQPGGFVAIGEIVPPIATIEPVTQFGQEPAGVSATFEGHVNPEALETGYHFEYSRDGHQWTSIPTRDLFLPGDSVEHAVEPQTATGLEGSTGYHVRLVATKIFNSGSAVAETTFTTPAAPPVVSGPSATGVSGSAAVLHGTINPENKPTKYHFECVTESQLAESGYAQAFRLPAGEEPTVEGQEVVAVSEKAAGLAPVTTYKCRLIAENEAGKTVGEEGSFTTFHSADAGLPDDRAYEQASPVDKNGNSAQGEVGAVQASASGERVVFYSNGGIPGGEGSQNFPNYLSTRSADGTGWTTQGLLPPATTGPTPSAAVLGWDDEMTHAFDTSKRPEGPLTLYARNNSGGGLTTLAAGNGEGIPSFAYADADRSGSRMLLEAAGEPLLAGAAAGANNVYLWDHENGLRLAGVLNDGEAPTGGAVAGPRSWFVAVGPGGAASHYYTQAENTLSQGGEAVFFTAVGSGQLYERLNPGQPQSAMSGGHCSEPAAACSVQISASQRSNSEGPEGGDPNGPQPAAFVGAGADASWALLMSPEELTNDANTGQFAIGRADLDGNSPEPAFLPVFADAIATDGTHIYWANHAGGSIGRANLDGSAVEPHFITGANNPRGVAVDGGHIYWTNAGSGANGTGTIGRANIAGGEVNQAFITGASNPQGIAVTETNIFWANAGSTEGTRRISRSTLAGGSVIPGLVTVTGTSGPYGLTTQGSFVYWTNPAANSIGRVKVDGTELAQSLIAGASNPQGISADDNAIFWSNAGSDAIGRADLDGSDAEQSFVSDIGGIRGVATDGSHLLWSSNEGDRGNDLYRYETSSGKLTDLSVDSDDPNGAEVKGVLGTSADGTFVYFVAAGQLAPGAPPSTCTGDGESINGLCNLYLWHEGSVSYITQLGARRGASLAREEDLMDWAPTALLVAGEEAQGTARVTADGRTLVFRSSRQLTGYDNHGISEFYRYVVGSSGLSCITCNPTAAPPIGPASVQSLPKRLLGPKNPTAIHTRNLSADGTRFFFDSPDKLVSSDVNGDAGCKSIGSGDARSCEDVYEWEADGTGSCHSDIQGGGCLYLISTGTSPEPSYFADAGGSGRDVFFFTSQPLVGQDKDELVDVYDAREGGGIPGQSPLPVVPCEGEACRGPAPAAPAATAPGTASLSNPANFGPKRKACPKGRRAVKKGGKVRCVKRAKPHRHRKRHNRDHQRKGRNHHKKRGSGR